MTNLNASTDGRVCGAGGPSGPLLHQRSLGPVRVLTAEGIVDGRHSSRLADALHDLAAEPERGGLVVDMTGVEFIDCSGLEALLRFHERMHDAGRLWALAASRPVARPLTSLRVPYLVVCDNSMEAFAYCHAHAPVGA